MNTNNCQVWEGEMEASGLEENGISFITAIFSMFLGLLLFFVLIGKTILQSVFKIKFGTKRNTSSSIQNSNLEVSVS
jgi:hypothetical protein